MNLDEHMIHRVRTKSIKYSAISRLPKILCLKLQRLFHSLSGRLVKQTQHVSFPLRLSQSLFRGTHGCSISSSSAKFYNLNAVITHQGSAEAGHYTTYALVTTIGNQSKRWYMFSDQQVKECSISSVLSCQAFMLFYELEE